MDDILLLYYHSRDDAETGKYAFYVLFVLFLALLIGVVIKVFEQIYK